MAAEATRSFKISSERDLRVFYDETFDEVFRYARRLAGSDRERAEDLVHDAFVALVRELRAGVDNEIGVGWLLTVVRNRFLDETRRDKRSARQRIDVAGTREAPSTGRTVTALVGLQPIARAALVLHHVDGYSVSEMAESIGKSTSATESLLVRARATMKRILAEGGHDA